jgi:hypothetical protein
MRIKIASVGEPVLRNVARPLRREEIGSRRIRELIEHMRETLADASGVGLAAPQIGDPLQLAIVEDKAEYQANLTAEELVERERRPVPFPRSDAQSVLRTLSNRLPFHSLPLVVKPSPLIRSHPAPRKYSCRYPRGDLRFRSALKRRLRQLHLQRDQPIKPRGASVGCPVTKALSHCPGISGRPVRPH